MKNLFFAGVLLILCTMQLNAQESSVKILLNEEERFRFVDQRLEFINPGYHVLIGENTGNNMDSAAVYNVFIGSSAGSQNTEGIRNSFLGTASGEGNTTGDRNSYFGANSGQFNSTGKYNSFFGQGAGYNSLGSYNTFIGRVAGFNNRGDSSVFLGYGAGANDTASNRLYISNSTTIDPLVYGEFDNQILRFNVKKVDITSPYKNTIIGDSAGMLTVSPANVFIGMGSGNKTISGEENTFIGYKAGYENITGKENIFIGYRTGYENIDGIANVFLGNRSGHSNSEGSYNVFLGYWAGYSNSEGSNNVFVGGSAGVYNSTGILNTFIGRSAGFHNISGNRNTFVGLSAGGYNISGSKNTYIGRAAGYLNETGDSNVFIGNKAGYNEMGSDRLYIANSDTIAPLIYGEFDNELLRIHGTLDIKGIYQFPIVDGTGGQVLKTDGSGNLHWSGDAGAIQINDLSDGKTGGGSVFLGSGAGLNDNGSNNYNVGVGLGCLVYTITGEFNTGVGSYSLLMTSTGTNNTATGYKALYNNTTAGYNTASGALALFNNISGGYNTAIGSGSLYQNFEGYYNTASGYNALYHNQVSYNTAYGADALYSNSYGINNTAVGFSAMMNNFNGNYNTAVGCSALAGNSFGNSNTAMGYMANYYNEDGSQNTIIGCQAGQGNTLHDKSGNVFIGYQAGYSETGNNKLYIENSDTIAPLIYGDFENDTLRVNGTLDINNAFHFPLTDGTSGQVLQSNGSGTLSWAAVGGDFSNGGEAGGANRSLGNTDNYDLSIKTNNTNRIKIKNDGGIRLDGKLGIFTDPASPGINNSIKLYDAVTFSNPYLEISGHNRAYIHLQSRRTGNTSETSGKTWSIASGSGSIADLDMFYIYNPDDGYCFTIRDGGNIGVNTTEPTAKMDINGSTGYDQLRIRTSFTPTSSSDTNGNTGDIAWDDDYIYIKTSTGWKRSALTSW